MEKIHFIGIGGGVMHNLAISLHKNVIEVTGSDERFTPLAQATLERNEIMPKDKKWHPEKISQKLDAIILGQYALADNPELLKAQELGLKIYSYPEYIYEKSKNKKRIVIGGSNGKTTITTLIIHALTFNNIDVDFLVGEQLEGFDTILQLTNNAEIIVRSEE